MPLSRRFWLSHGLPPLLLAALLFLVFEYTGLDHASVVPYYGAEGFHWSHQHWFVKLFHSYSKIPVALLCLVSAVAAIVCGLRRNWRRYAWPLAYLALGLTLSTSIIRSFKRASGVLCPFQLSEFGGTGTYHRLLEAWQLHDPAGQCWPGGHASTGFCLFALYFALHWLGRRRAAGYAFAGALVYGHLLGYTQVMRGQHFLSHQFWTSVVCWYACLGLYGAMRALAGLRLVAFKQDAAGEQEGQLAARLGLVEEVDTGQ